MPILPVCSEFNVFHVLLLSVINP